MRRSGSLKGCDLVRTITDGHVERDDWLDLCGERDTTGVD
jgi:hypothetical protein